MSSIARSREGWNSTIQRSLQLGIVCLICWSAPLVAQETLNQAIENITQTPRFKHAHWGALFVDQKSNEVLFEHQSDKLFIPASTTKPLFRCFCPQRIWCGSPLRDAHRPQG